MLTTYQAAGLEYYWVGGGGEWGETITVPLSGGGSLPHMAHWYHSK